MLLQVAPNRVRGDESRPVALGFSSVFWNTAWTRGQAPHTLGILCDPEHPAFEAFPTDFHSNWQWWYLVTRAAALVLDDLGYNFNALTRRAIALDAAVLTSKSRALRLSDGDQVHAVCG